MTGVAQKFDGGFQVRASLCEEHVSAIPSRRGVVLLVGAKGKPILLMTGANMRLRVRNRLENPDEQQRRRIPNLYEVTQGVFWKLTGGHFETDLYYLDLVRSIFPTRYKSMVSWKPPWFVHVDPRDAYPQFVRTREVGTRAGRCFGPFESARSTDRYIEALQDAFDLCRNHRVLRKAPHASACSYGQMGRCLLPCDGTVSSTEYREVILRAVSFVTGDTRGVREQLSEQMQEASRELQFERAGNFKGRIERFGKFDKPEYRFVRPLDEFRFVFIQPGGNQRQVKVFFVDRGAIAPQGVLKYPLAGEQLVKTVRRIDGFVDSRSDLEMGDVLRMGLVSRYLFSAPRRAGVILPWTGSVTVEQIAEAIESGKKLLRLKEPAKRPRDKKGGAY